MRSLIAGLNIFRSCPEHLIVTLHSLFLFIPDPKSILTFKRNKKQKKKQKKKKKEAKTTSKELTRNCFLKLKIPFPPQTSTNS
ncbi:hypothetical protein C0J52_09141 [Blattella germanica]|nr:hypothetical protein C0J52_09141 [Blattella germanica]